ncbi:hypothetical protein FCI23_50645 [Actinacidiphila oryziradicis]|uniref:Uncharacterized protein n=1 Tax=Actinacidiphila oryziradicis TaxID=2571141 RepID=A0A4U0RL85_9ACTN|nr:hypothetical protein FCI23_50645 [Actinacidiphila oryziradicis]
MTTSPTASSASTATEQVPAAASHPPLHRRPPAFQRVGGPRRCWDWVLAGDPGLGHLQAGWCSLVSVTVWPLTLVPTSGGGGPFAARRRMALHSVQPSLGESRQVVVRTRQHLSLRGVSPGSTAARSLHVWPPDGHRTSPQSGDGKANGDKATGQSVAPGNDC